MQSNKMSAMSDSMIAIATGRNLVIFRTLTFSLNGRQPILKMTQTEDHQKGRTIEQFALEDKLDFSLKEAFQTKKQGNFGQKSPKLQLGKVKKSSIFLFSLIQM